MSNEHDEEGLIAQVAEGRYVQVLPVVGDLGPGYNIRFFRAKDQIPEGVESVSVQEYIKDGVQYRGVCLYVSAVGMDTLIHMYELLSSEVGPYRPEPEFSS